MNTKDTSSIKWNNDELQFARLISELQAAGAFTEQVMQDLQTFMDLDVASQLQS